jgi:hypothetical protein
VAFSPGGQHIVTGSLDGTAKVWDTETGEELLTLKGHHRGLYCIIFSADGRLVATGSIDQTAKIWDAASGEELLTLKEHAGPIHAVAFSPDSRRIITGSTDMAKVWETASGNELLALKGHGNIVRCVAFSPDGRRIITGSTDMTAKVWEAASGKELLTLKGHSNGVTSVVFSTDGQRIITAGWDETVKIWESATTEQVISWQQEEKAAGERLAAFQREGDYFVTGGTDDAEEYKAGNIILHNGDLDLARSEGAPEDIKAVGIRFVDIRIPKGTHIKKANLQFTVEDESDEPTDLMIQAELSGNAEPFTRADYSISSRKRTKASVKWSPEPWDFAGERSEKQQSPDLSSLIQEVIDQNNWQEGNALALIISGSGDRDAISFESGGQRYAPMLHIEH